MPDNTLKPAIRASLRMHEIGDKSPYQLFFAAKGKSGASFGVMQGDLAAGQTEVAQTFKNAMAAAAIPSDATSSLLQRLSAHLIGNPLDPKERDQVNDALAGSSPLVDAMDEGILGKVYSGVDTCISRAHVVGREITPESQILMAMWINMTGPPSKILAWLDGGNPGLSKPVPTPGSIVDGDAVCTYLRATDYYQQNPQNFAHLIESLNAGLKGLPSSSGAAAMAGVAAATASTFPQNCYVYEQATGRIIAREDGLNDLLATGYSGSEAKGGKNNPSAQSEPNVGPIPRGKYSIGEPFTGPSPFSLRLTPDPANQMFGRDGFLIHGDSVAEPGTASHGCIILPRPIRERINKSKVDVLTVVERLN